MLSAANNRKVNPNGRKQCGNVFAHIRSPEVKRAPGRMQLGPKLCFLQFCCLCPDFQLCSQAGSLCICKRVSSSNWGNMLSPSCLVKERAKPLPQELNACTFPLSIWTLLEHMPTHGPIASSEMPWMDWLSMGWTGCQEGFNCITPGHFPAQASPQ